MDLGLRGKSVLVTGGSQGIGRAIALAFADEGANVAICARHRDALERTEAELKERGVKTLSLVVNLYNEAECAQAVEETAKTFGRLDVLVNNGAAAGGGTLETLTTQELIHRLEGKAFAAMNCSRAAIPHMRQAGGGRIISIAGGAARTSSRGGLPTGVNNAAMAAFSKYLSDEVAGDGILVNTIHPSLTKTSTWDRTVKNRAEQLGISEAEAEAKIHADFPIGRAVEPGDIGPLAVFLASTQASAITGQTIAVDGGLLRAVSY